MSNVMTNVRNRSPALKARITSSISDETKGSTRGRSLDRRGGPKRQQQERDERRLPRSPSQVPLAKQIGARAKGVERHELVAREIAVDADAVVDVKQRERQTDPGNGEKPTISTDLGERWQIGRGRQSFHDCGDDGGQREICERDKAQRPQLTRAQFTITDVVGQKRFGMDDAATTAPLPQREHRSTTRFAVANAKAVDAALEEDVRGDALRGVLTAVIDDEPIINPQPAAIVRLGRKAEKIRVVGHQHAPSIRP